MKRAALLLSLSVCVLLAPVNSPALGIGDDAPLFTAESDRGPISLESYLGEKYVILAFYIAINTPA